MRHDYHDRVVVVTGAGSGIGRALSLLLARRGARLVLAGRRAANLEETARRIAETGGEAPLVAPCDVTDEQQVAALRDRVLRERGAAHVLVNNAGRGAFGHFHSVPVADYRAVVETNLLGVIHATHAFLPHMLERGEGQLVFVSSVLGELPAPEHAVYGATKFAVSGLAESLGYELAGRGIGVVLVEPGLVHSEFAAVARTPMARFDSLPSKSSEAAAAEVLRAMDWGRRRHVTHALVGVVIWWRRHWPRSFRVLFAAAYRRARGRG